MSIIGIFPPLLFCFLFALPTWWLWRNGRRQWALIPGSIGFLLFLFTVTVFLQDRLRIQQDKAVAQLLKELNREDLFELNDLAQVEDRLFLASSASQALFRARTQLPDRLGAIDSTLFVLASWVAQRDNFSQWGRGVDRDREVYFLAHAGITLGHYQVATRDEQFGEAFRTIGEHIGKRLQRGRYKHLGSRAGEDFFRPADNAAATYALRLYDQYYATTYSGVTIGDWTTYIREELHYQESRLPCAAFSATNRCRLEPSATATGLYICYRAAAIPEETQSDIPWQEWMHYFKQSSGSPFTVSIRSNMRDGETARFCDLGAMPLSCNQYENEIGLWGAAEYGGWYTYFRLFSVQVLQDWFGAEIDLAGLRPVRRIPYLTEMSLRALGMGHP
jgi:hypothetical protein